LRRLRRSITTLDTDTFRRRLRARDDKSSPLTPIAEAAAALLAMDDFSLVKRCEDENPDRTAAGRNTCPSVSDCSLAATGPRKILWEATQVG
jgi:predicted RNA-binding Zn ribbon-like protein